MQTMTLKQYLSYKILKEISGEAEKEGIKLVIDKPKPRLATTEGSVVQLLKREDDL